jgi:hypothetical protein
MVTTLDRIVVDDDDDNNNYHKMSEEVNYNNSLVVVDYSQFEIDMLWVDSIPDDDMAEELNHLFQLLM